MERQEKIGIANWMLQDLQEQAARLDDGKFLADLDDIGTILCKVEEARVRTLMAATGINARIQIELELVLPCYLALLKESIDRAGEETYLTANEFAELLASHGKVIADVLPKLPLESGRKGYALMQAAAALASLDDVMAGPWYLALKSILVRPAIENE